jgi:hypothetical protein
MKNLLIGLLAIGLSAQFYAQVIDDGMLPEVLVRATNYKYLNSVDNSEAAVSVQYLEDMAAKFDTRSSEFYEDRGDFYRVYFYIPEGTLVAAYDRKGKILYTIEKYKDVALPRDVLASVAERFPGWTIAKDVYKVSFDVKSGSVKEYKIVLKNGKETMRVKVDEEGVFL